jgi:NAD(P)-dependent dehydrogenase (short-subunit alcohol dehydrogenase family)
MSKLQNKVAVVTGASQGIGAGLVEAYRAAGFKVVANSRSITPSSDEGVLAIAGDIADPAVAERVIAGAVDRFGRHPDQQRRHLHGQAVHGIHAGGL